MPESNQRKLTCILCKHIEFDPGFPAYSEVTPGCSWSLGCKLGKWSMSGDDVESAEKYKEYLLMAEHCDDYKYEGGSNNA